MVEANVSLWLSRIKREFDGKECVLTKINHAREDAEEDQAYHSKRGKGTRNVNEDGF